jgi:hypothetical protein
MHLYQQPRRRPKRQLQKVKPNLLQKRTQKRLLKQLSQPAVLASNLSDEDDDGYDEYDVCVSYRRPELVHEKHKLNGDLSDHVKFRLWLARQLALAKYQEKWSG